MRRPVREAMSGLCIVIPVRNDNPALARLVGELEAAAGTLEAIGEIVVVDGGSAEDPVVVLPPAVRRLRAGAANRGAQLALGIEAARCEWLWLLHADTTDVGPALDYLRCRRAPGWGRFDVRLRTSAGAPWRRLVLVATLMNWRSRLTGICTGDQGIFVHRALLERIGGMPEQPLMEDIELCRRLKRLGRPACPRVALTTSARRWEERGLLRTVLSMWRFRLRYWLGADPERLASEYYGGG